MRGVHCSAALTQQLARLLGLRTHGSLCGGAQGSFDQAVCDWLLADPTAAYDRKGSGLRPYCSRVDELSANQC